MSKRSSGKVALVTGAGSGIGRATAELLAGEGAAAKPMPSLPRGGPFASPD